MLRLAEGAFGLSLLNRLSRGFPETVYRKDWSFQTTEKLIASVTRIDGFPLKTGEQPVAYVVSWQRTRYVNELTNQTPWFGVLDSRLRTASQAGVVVDGQTD